MSCARSCKYVRQQSGQHRLAPTFYGNEKSTVSSQIRSLLHPVKGNGRYSANVPSKNECIINGWYAWQAMIRRPKLCHNQHYVCTQEQTPTNNPSRIFFRWTWNLLSGRFFHCCTWIGSLLNEHGTKATMCNVFNICESHVRRLRTFFTVVLEPNIHTFSVLSETLPDFLKSKLC